MPILNFSGAVQPDPATLQWKEFTPKVAPCQFSANLIGPLRAELALKIRWTSPKLPLICPVLLHDSVIGTGPTAGGIVSGRFCPVPVCVRHQPSGSSLRLRLWLPI